MNHIYGMSVLSLLRRVRACPPGPLSFIDAHVLVWLKIKFKCTKNALNELLLIILFFDY